MFHMEIVQERLEREYDLDLLVTAPSVEYQAVLTNGEVVQVDRPSDMPDPSELTRDARAVDEDQIFTPKDYIGPIMDLVTKRRGESVEHGISRPERVMLTYRMPLAEMIIDFYDKLKSAPERLCLARLSASTSYRSRRPGQARHSGQRRAGRRAGADRPPRRRAAQGQPADDAS